MILFAEEPSHANLTHALLRPLKIAGTRRGLHETRIRIAESEPAAAW
jgi:hypothetical protein